MEFQNGNNIRSHELLGPIAAFVYAAELGGFSAAGNVLGISGSAVGKSVERLENRLGVRLLHRTTRSLTLTHAGADYFEHAQLAVKELEYAESELLALQQKPKGRLKISMPQNLGHRILSTVLADFTILFPEIILDVQLEDRMVDVVAESVDVVIRTGRLPDSLMVAVRIGIHQCLICGSPAYFSRIPPPIAPEQLEQHRGIFFRLPYTEKLFPWLLNVEYAHVNIHPIMIFNTSAGVLESIRAGVGLGQLPDYIARPYIKSGELIPVLEEYMAPRGDVWVAWASNRHRSAAHKILVDFLKEKLPLLLSLPFKIK